MTRQVDLSIIIVSWNVADLLAACLRSIAAGPVQVIDANAELPPADSGNLPDNTLTVEVIVLDSASADHSLEVLTAFPKVKVMAQAENIGFTKGNNLALRAARGRLLMLLNPDTEVIGDALPVLAAYLNEHPDVGVVGPQTLNTDGSVQSTRRQFPTLVTALFESTWLQPIAPPGVLRRYYLSDRADSDIFDVGWMQGSALMFRRDVYDQIGGLDEGFVMYSEEMDWCKRVFDARWRLVYVGAAQITHHGGKSTDQVVARRHIHFQQSKIRYFTKHHGKTAGAVLRGYLLTLYVWQLGVEWGKGLLGHKRELRQERVTAYREVLRSGLRVED